MEPKMQGKLTSIKERLSTNESPCEKMPENGAVYNGPHRQTAQTMIRERIGGLRREADRLEVLLKILDLGMEQYGDGAAKAEEALWEALSYPHRSKGW